MGGGLIVCWPLYNVCLTLILYLCSCMLQMKLRNRVGVCARVCATGLSQLFAISRLHCKPPHTHTRTHNTSIYEECESDKANLRSVQLHLNFIYANTKLSLQANRYASCKCPSCSHIGTKQSLFSSLFFCHSLFPDRSVNLILGSI